MSTVPESIDVLRQSVGELAQYLVDTRNAVQEQQQVLQETRTLAGTAAQSAQSAQTAINIGKAASSQGGDAALTAAVAMTEQVKTSINRVLEVLNSMPQHINDVRFSLLPPYSLPPSLSLSCTQIHRMTYLNISRS